MSGGGNRKKTSRSEGWEEAGSEFYQESYPGDPEIEVLQRDPKHLHTLLPSKQTRGGATIRLKTNDYRTNNRTIRKHTTTRSRRESTGGPRRASIPGEVQVSMLPDLSEMRSNEQTAWEDIMLIKSLPVPMAEKKEMKAKILNEPNLRLQGYEQFKWKRRKMWDHVKARLVEHLQKLNLWGSSMRSIEGNYGVGILSYFIFVKWLFMLNLFIFALIFAFVVLPTILLDTNTNKRAYCPNVTSTGPEQLQFLPNESNKFLDLIQGTGVLEHTLLFYGYYSSEPLSYSIKGWYYNLPVAYLLIVILCFVVSAFAALNAAASGFKERLIEGQGQFYHYSSLVFGGWDFCVRNRRAADIKHKVVYNELKAGVETQRLEDEIRNRTAHEKYKIYFSRAIVNTAVLAILGGCGCVIYLVFRFSTERLSQTEDTYENLFYEFLPSFTIVGLNMTVPHLFKFLIGFEKYKPLSELKFSLIRTVFLRLSALIVLYASLWSKVNDSQIKGCSLYNKTPVCWESYVGQQIYKLLLTDFAIQVVVTLIINSLRALLARHVENKCVKFFAEQHFDLPKHALDVVYTQTLIWFGIFYAPLISLMGAIMFFFLFYIKRFACTVNCRPSPIVYRASRSNSLFMFVLLISFAFASIPLGFSFSDLTPSKACGPFKGEASVWSLAVGLFRRTPDWLQSVIFFLGTAGFAIPCIVVLVLLLYYYTAVNLANKQLVRVLKNQLVLEGHDKQFLLDRLSLFIKQEQQKRLRIEQSRDAGDHRS
ncbi:unnamed protein product [Phyllotreta striolata]|uniref:TMC domain-containing protein n=1 Tax=Phyllotreta striolata TaxID=444603 RepID=A0A9N9TJ89_PHYSR|nr:unnamed protein product [Phyllotreta striolata]